MARPAIALTAAIAGLLLPVILVSHPPVLDYPNHWARLWLLSGAGRGTPLDAMYGTDWAGTWTNIGTDLVAAWVGPVLGAGVVIPGLLALALISPVVGAATLNRVIHGRWSAWQVGFALFAWNTTFLMGFMNFQIGLGLALLAAAAESVIAKRGAPLAMVLRVVLVLGLAVVHPAAAMFYLALLAGLAWGREAHGAFGPRLRRGLMLMAPPLLALGLFGLAMPRFPAARVDAAVFDFGDAFLMNKLTTLGSPLLTYSLLVDFTFVVGFWAMVHALPVLRRWVGGVRMHAGLLLAAGTLLLLGLVTPGVLGGTAFADWRFPVMALFTALAAIRPEWPGRAGLAIGAALLLLSLGRSAWIGSVWQARSADAAAVARALQPVPPGAAVLPAVLRLPPSEPYPLGRPLRGLPSFAHLPALAVPWRQAFVPTLFAERGKHVLRVLPPWDAIAVPEGVTAQVEYLSHYEPPVGEMDLLRYLADWRRRFDFVLLLNTDQPSREPEPPLPPELELVRNEGFARLYRIRR